MGDVVALRPEDGNSCSFRLIWSPDEDWIEGPVSTRYVAVSILDARRIRMDQVELAMRRRRAQNVARLSTILSTIYGDDGRAQQAARAIHVFLAGVDLTVSR